MGTKPRKVTGLRIIHYVMGKGTFFLEGYYFESGPVMKYNLDTMKANPLCMEIISENWMAKSL